MSVRLKTLTIYAARSVDGGFGMFDGSLPWHCPQDLSLFAKVTTLSENEYRNTMFMGRKTYESVGDLPNRNCIPISRKETMPELLWLPNGGIGYSQHVFMIGGKESIQSTMREYEPDCLILSTIETEAPHADTRVSDRDFHLDKYHLYSFKQFDGFHVHVYVKDPVNPLVPPGADRYIPHCDAMYSNLVEYVLRHGQERQDRTGNGTLSCFAPMQLRFDDISETFPLLTTKKVFLRGVLEELAWFLRGSTDSKELEARGVNIWRGNTSAEFIRARGLEYDEGQTGPIYGKQWRNFGGVDQIQTLVEQIKADPESRRHVVSAWNPPELGDMVLPPCHCFFQTSIRMGKFIDMGIYMRSCDVALGLPFNICSYAALMHILSVKTGYKTGSLVFSFGDCHIYKDHIGPLKEQISRKSMASTRLKSVENKSFDDYQACDFDFSTYFSHPNIPMKMAV